MPALPLATLRLLCPPGSALPPERHSSRLHWARGPPRAPPLPGPAHTGVARDRHSLIPSGLTRTTHSAPPPAAPPPPPALESPGPGQVASPTAAHSSTPTLCRDCHYSGCGAGLASGSRSPRHSARSDGTPSLTGTHTRTDSGD